MINANKTEIHMLMEQHNPYLSGAYGNVEITGCDCDDRKFTSDGGYFEHLAEALAAELPPSLDVHTQWGIEIVKPNGEREIIGSLQDRQTVQEIMDTSNGLTRVKRQLVKRICTPWEPAD